MDKTDEQLAVEYVEGNAEALDLLIKRYLKPVYNFSYYYLGDSADIQDVTQETFVKVWRNLKKFDPKRKFKTWIFEIAKNTALDHLKKKRPLSFSNLLKFDDDQPDFEDTLSDEGPLADELLDEKMTREAVLSAIAILPPDYRAVIVLRYVDQFDFAEVAETLKRPLNTVKSQYRRAVEIMKKHLADRPL